MQLPLDIGLNAPSPSFANYFPGNNQIVLHTLERIMRGEAPGSLYLCGASGTGKTHLLHAACREISRYGGVSAYFPLADICRYPTDALEGVETLDLVCLDDLHSIAGLTPWEHAIFSLFNRLHEAHIPLLISADSVPGALYLGLKDLASRLSWGGVFLLQSLSAPARRQAVRLHARALGLELSEAVLNYLLEHCPPDMKSLINRLEYLDYTSLAAKRPLTLPFIRSVLKNTRTDTPDSLLRSA